MLALCGDLADYGLKNSKTNVYKAVMQPKEQQEYVYELFKPIAEKIVSAVPGNHEERITKEVGLFRTLHSFSLKQKCSNLFCSVDFASTSCV